MPLALPCILAAITVCCCLAVAGRLLFQISASRARRRAAAAARASPATRADPQPETEARPPPPRPYNALCILGSGGHTAEMLSLVEALLGGRAPPARITYLATATDGHSLSKAGALHARGGGGGGARAPVVVLARVPRAREVHQSWASSALASARCLAAAAPAVVRAQPDVVVANGPGSAVVVVAAALTLRAAGVVGARVVYVESVARTRSLSLSGRLLYHVVDRFIVQWPALQAAYPLAEFHGRLT